MLLMALGTPVGIWQLLESLGVATPLARCMRVAVMTMDSDASYAVVLWKAVARACAGNLDEVRRRVGTVILYQHGAKVDHNLELEPLMEAFERHMAPHWDADVAAPLLVLVLRIAYGGDYGNRSVGMVARNLLAMFTNLDFVAALRWMVGRALPRWRDDWAVKTALGLPVFELPWQFVAALHAAYWLTELRHHQRPNSLRAVSLAALRADILEDVDEVRVQRVHMRVLHAYREAFPTDVSECPMTWSDTLHWVAPHLWEHLYTQTSLQKFPFHEWRNINDWLVVDPSTGDAFVRVSDRVLVGRKPVRFATQKKKGDVKFFADGPDLALIGGRRSYSAIKYADELDQVADRKDDSDDEVDAEEDAEEDDDGGVEPQDVPLEQLDADAAEVAESGAANGDDIEALCEQ